MQLLTRSAHPIHDALCAQMQAYAAGGRHVTPHPSLDWPTTAAHEFERLALRCMAAASPALLADEAIPALHALLRGAPDAPCGERPPPAFLCPLTRGLMLDPVALADGFVYERAAAEQWLSSGQNASPMTGAPLTHPYLTPQHEQRRAIQNWLLAHPDVQR